MRGTTSHHQFKYPDSNKLGYHHEANITTIQLATFTNTGSPNNRFVRNGSFGAIHAIGLLAIGVGV